MIKSISKSKSNNNTNQKIINKYNQVKQVYKSPIIPQFIIIITFLPATIIITYLLKTNNLLLIFVKIKIYIYIYLFNSLEKFRITKFYYNRKDTKHNWQIKK